MATQPPVFGFREFTLSNERRVLIVDDEPLARQKLRRYLEGSGFALHIVEAENGLRAVELIHEFQPEIIFLDIQMPGFSGFDVLRQFEQRPFLVIFQTAFDTFAIQAFEAQACDYLLKPFTPQRFQKALAQAMVRLVDEEKLQQLESKLAERTGPLRRLAVKQGLRTKILEDHEIHCFVSRDHCTCVYFGSQGEAILDFSLTYLTTRLDPARFRQFHRNNIVRIEAVRTLHHTRTGEVIIELCNGLKLPVSRSNRRIVRELLKEMC